MIEMILTPARIWIDVAEIVFTWLLPLQICTEIDMLLAHSNVSDFFINPFFKM